MDEVIEINKNEFSWINRNKLSRTNKSRLSKINNKITNIVINEQNKFNNTTNKKAID